MEESKILITCQSKISFIKKAELIYAPFEYMPFCIAKTHKEHKISNLVLSEMNQSKLPLLGDFVLEEVISINSFSPADLNEIQSLLIRLITSQNSHGRNFQGALLGFGYWFKNMAGKLCS
ncbi:hypothetical protein VP01_1007g2 [Puccinia sorghi]|uniref:Uncharacterized protein n=1 Tax=Puccinia sorghi TaxID=27349 RepID=A0A0L6VV51_9BASI|nr:hypothetical protein VP01_1007g2 [Puccinia sorghi]